MEMDRQIVYRLHTDKSIVSFYLSIEPNGKPSTVLGGVWGYIEVEPVSTANKESCFWDNLKFFLNESFEEIKKDCKQELKDKDLHSKGFFKDFKKFLKVVRREVENLKGYGKENK